MRKDKTFIILSAVGVAFMMVLFTIMIVMISNNSTKLASKAENPTTENELNSEITVPESEVTSEGLYSIAMEETQEVEEDITVSTNEDGNMMIGDTVIYMSKAVDLELEDTAIKAVENEDHYINTQDLLPSLNNEREPIPKEKVSTANFPKSYASDKYMMIKFSDASSGDNKKTVVIVPSDVYLYNAEGKDANGYNIEAVVDGDSSLIKSIGWSVADETVISLSKTSGYKTRISRAADYTGTKEIKVVITYYTNQKHTATATDTKIIKVHVGDMDNEKASLYGKNNEQLYLDKDGKKKAHLSDYSKYDTFYGDKKLTGWIVVDGKKHYYDSKGQSVTGEQIIGGTKYDFDDKGVLISRKGAMGIDVSYWQKKIDWKAVAASGVEFAIIRCGFRGAVGGQLVEDSRFRENIEGAKANGIKVGVYFFTQAITKKEAREEARMVIALCEKYELDLPAFIDSEDAVNGRANGLNRRVRTDTMIAFCETINQAGLTAGIYASKFWFYDKLYADELEKYQIWCAQYSKACDYKGKKDYWQYSSSEKINGIEGNVDVDLIIE